MGALATAAPAAFHAPPPAPTEGPNAWWEKSCEERNYTRWPFDLHTTLYRACRGNATALAICMEIAQLTHGQMARRRGGRPEWTNPLATEYFADRLGVTVRAVQDALSLLLELEMIERRAAANRAHSYQVRPWAWENLAESTGKDAQGAQSEGSEDQAKPPVLKLTDAPLIVLPGAKSRPVPLDDAMRATMRTVSWKNSTGLKLEFSSSLLDGNLGIEVRNLDSSAKFTSPSDAQVAEKNTPAVSGVREKLRSGINERFARPSALVIPIDEAMLDAALANLTGDPDALLALLDTARHRKRVIEEGYGLIRHIAKNVPTGFSTKNSSPSKTQVVENTEAAILFDTSNDETEWPKIRAAMLKQDLLSAEAYENWFARSRGEGLSIDGKTLIVSVPDGASALVLHEEYGALIDRKAAELHSGIERVQFRALNRVE